MASKKAAKKVAKVMREYKSGTLHSGKGGPVVKSRRQAIAIAMSEAKMAKKPVKKAAKKAAKKPMHRMPNGKMMEGAKHERTESKRERRREYGK